MDAQTKKQMKWIFVLIIMAVLLAAPTAAEDLYESETNDLLQNETVVDKTPVRIAEEPSGALAPEAHRMAIVAGGVYNPTDLQNAARDAPLNVTIVNGTEASLHDFSQEHLIFAASADNATIQTINATMNASALLVVYDPPSGTAVGTPADANTTAYWTYGGTENLRNMIIYLDNICFGNTTPFDPPLEPAGQDEHALTIVTDDPERRASITNVTATSPLTIALFNETEAKAHNFKNDLLVFAASVGTGTLEQINATATENATVVVYDPPTDSTFGTPADQNITRFWTYGGDANLQNMIIYMDNMYFGNTTPFSPPEQEDDDRPSIVMIIGGESYVPMYAEAGKKSQANVTVYASKQLPADLNLTGYDLIFMEMFGAGIDIIEPAVEKATAQGIPVAVLHAGQYEDLGTIDMTSHPNVEEYWVNSGPENARRLINYLGATICGADIPVQDPLPTPLECIYHPDAGCLFEDLDEYITWYTENSTYDPTKPTIGIVFYDSHYKSGDLKADHAIMREFEAEGANIIPVFLNYKDPHVIDRFFVKDGAPVVDAIVNIRCFRFYGSGDDPARGIEELKTYNIPIINALVDYSKTPEEWANSTDGVTSSKVGYSIAMPELDGQTEFILVAGRGIDPETEAIGFRPITPVDEQVRWLVERVMALSELRHTSNAGKNVAVIYYNHGGGKNNLGASYLDIVPSLTNLLTAMKEEGYSIDGEVPDKETLLDLMLLQGRNVGTWAPDELDRMVEEGDVVLLPVDQYTQWFHQLPADKQQEVIDTWGEPPGEIMTYTRGGQEYLVIPCISFGNVILTPQPTRGWLQDDEVLYHDKDLPPHHQYIAFYLWLQHEFEADAVVHFGRHGTQEWLPGKECGLSATDDWPALLIGRCPNIYPYIMDGLGEGTQAKRRGNAVIVDHLTPPIVAAGLYGNFSTLHEKIHTYNTVNSTLKEEYRKSITDLYQAMNINATLDLSPDEVRALSENEFADFINGDLHQYLHKLGDQFIPYGLHILGEPPEGSEQVSLVRSMLGEEFEEHVGLIYPEPHDLSAAHGNCTVMEALLTEVIVNGTDPVAAQNAVLGGSSGEVTADLNTAVRYAEDIEACSIEIPAIINALNGGYTPPKTGGDPVRSPESLPTGNNFHSFDSRTMPTNEAWNVGVQMADEMLEQYGEAHGVAYPEKVAFILWACESMRHEGVTESEALYLLGVKPIWSSGKVKGVELIPSEELGRPRIDTVFVASGLYRDTFADKIELLDEAVRLAAEAEGDLYPNYVKEHSEALYADLIVAGYDEEDARRLSMSRVFSSAPGAYGTGISSAVDSSDTWEDTSKLVDLFLSKMGYVYNGEDWGEPNKDLFRANLEDVDAAVHSRSSNVYGVVDNDDCFQYFGALSMVIESISGKGPDMFITDLRAAGMPETTTLREFIMTELDARYFNPKWIEGMMEHGYAGARYMDKKFLENLWGWTVTNPDLITSEVWDRVYDVYIKDEHDLGLKEFFAKNPYAYQSMVARMLETARKGYWNPDADVLEHLAEEFQQSVEVSGVTCCHHTCGNLDLSTYIQSLANANSADRSSDSSDDDWGDAPAQTANNPQAALPNEQPSGEGTQTNSSMSTGGYGKSPEVPAAPQAQADAGVSGQVMEEVNHQTDSTGTTTTPLVPILIVAIVIGAVFAGVWWKRT